MTRRLVLALSLSLTLPCGCKNTYYSVWEKLGWAKRDILVDRVEDARDEQQAAKKEFKTTLRKFQDLTGVKGGDLEAKYKKLSAAYEDCKERAEAVTGRINSVDSVATDLFKEWQAELSQYDNAELRKASEQKLTETKARFAQLMTTMRASEQKMAPVLKAFNDQVLFLKHNLNAQAISSLQSTAAGIDADVQKLLKDMEASINEANAFIEQMKKT
ncbi:MAG: DUF2959 domain-containing protein [Tepidisphaeraceae bacterium]